MGFVPLVVLRNEAPPEGQGRVKVFPRELDLFRQFRQPFRCVIIHFQRYDHVIAGNQGVDRGYVNIRRVVNHAEVVLIPHLFQRLFQPGLLLPRLIQKHFQIRFQQLHVCRDNVQAGEVRVLDQAAHIRAAGGHDLVNPFPVFVPAAVSPGSVPLLVIVYQQDAEALARQQMRNSNAGNGLCHAAFQIDNR